MDRFDTASDRELLRLTRTDPDAFGAFYRRHVNAVLAFCRRRTGSPELALDLTAEVFAAALEASGRYRQKDGHDGAGAWLYGIAQHKLADSHRRGKVEDRARRRLGMEPLEPTDEGIEQVELEASGDWLALMLGGLPEDQRDAVRARVIEETDYALVAQRLRCSEQVARKRVSRGLAALRSRMEGEI